MRFVGAMLLLPVVLLPVAGQSGCASPSCSDTATCVGSNAPTDAGADSQSACDPTNPDCTNAKCQSSFVCIPQVPSGWLGPIALFDQGGGPPAPTPLACTGAFGDDVFDANNGTSYGPVDCACRCGTAAGPCTSGSLGVYGDLDCQTQCATISPTTPSCTSAEGPGCNTGGGSAKLNVKPQPMGTWSCPPSTVLTATPWSWSRTGRGCGITRALAAGGCGANSLCADNPPTGFQPTLCVYTNAVLHDCGTAKGYPVIHNYYGAARDNRTCDLGTCGCSSPTGTSCNLTGTGQWFTSASPTCTSGGTTIDSSGTCSMASTGSQVVWIVSNMTETTSGSCTPSGAASPSGSVSPDTTTGLTVCCAD